MLLFFINEARRNTSERFDQSANNRLVVCSNPFSPTLELRDNLDVYFWFPETVVTDIDHAHLDKCEYAFKCRRCAQRKPSLYKPTTNEYDLLESVHE